MIVYIKRTLFSPFIVSLFLFGAPSGLFAQKPVSYVDPAAFPAAPGAVFPGAALPFGMVQLKPEETYAPGGFSHTHLDGRDAAENGTILVTAWTGPWQVAVGPAEDGGTTGLSFRPAVGEVSPGYCSATLQEGRVRAELTATLHTGLHRYTFPASSESNILIDLKSGPAAAESFIEVTATNEVAGMRRTAGGAPVYFVARASRPFAEMTLAQGGELQEDVAPVAGRRTEGKASRAFLRFVTREGEDILLKVALSYVDIEGARKNLEAELGHWNFNKTRKEALTAWEMELERIEIKGGAPDQLKAFYTALYHTLTEPGIAMDVDRRYRGADGEIQTAAGFSYYSFLPAEDPFGVLYSLYGILFPGRYTDMVRSLLAVYVQSGSLPPHSVPVLAGALLKDVGTFDKDLAYKALMQSVSESSRERKYDIEYSYDNWCVARAAKRLERKNDSLFAARALYYRDRIDTVPGAAEEPDNRGKGAPLTASAGLGDVFVPHDMPGLIGLLGGDEAFTGKLDTLLAAGAGPAAGPAARAYGGVAYLYTYAGQPWKTQAVVRRIMEKLAAPRQKGPAGKGTGELQPAWYVFSALGFYPVNPVSGEYVIGSPLFEDVTIHAGGDEDFEIRLKNDDPRVDRYVQYVALNRRIYHFAYIRHEQIMKGGKMELNMVAVPSYEWAVSPSYRPGRGHAGAAVHGKEDAPPVPPDARRRGPRRR